MKLHKSEFPYAIRYKIGFVFRFYKIQLLKSILSFIRNISFTCSNILTAKLLSPNLSINKRFTDFFLLEKSFQYTNGNIHVESSK